MGLVLNSVFLHAEFEPRGFRELLLCQSRGRWPVEKTSRPSVPQNSMPRNIIEFHIEIEVDAELRSDSFALVLHAIRNDVEQRFPKDSRITGVGWSSSRIARRGTGINPRRRRRSEEPTPPEKDPIQ